MAKQQILFVDDEPMLLQGLQRLLRPFRMEWDMAFVESGQAALERLAEHPFDVIVTDMRMPGMNGAELLNEVMRRYPAMVRIVLSGHADKELVTQCVGTAHQYISKPCDPDQLKAMIRNACALSGRLVDEEVRKVIGAIDRLPTIPEVYLELKEALSQEDVDSSELGAIIQKDIGMTAKILKLVNSSFFGLRRVISTPQDAVTYLGLDTVRTLVLTNSIFEQSKPLLTKCLSISDLWQHSLSVASGAKAVADCEKLGRSGVESAFVGGILHDVGMLILASNFAETYDKAADLVVTEKVIISTAEQEFFGVTHAEVGAYLLGLWGLPAEILNIVSLHHRVHLQDEGHMTPLIAVHAADIFSGVLTNHPLFESGRLNQVAIERAGVQDRVRSWEALVKEAVAGTGGA
ncbi:signal transduction protein [Geothrix limicola]|uniref:Signal transduction protein n=1 Tax=Geothrix limicola TaxID=2927978 RepID=A0ABQ5QB90_9BACT|nr:response regulator [Geothrix limicola]GLH71967.1 signal transduction protein [Geothrix limicola]